MFLFCNDKVQSTGKGAKRSSETETLLLLSPNSIELKQPHVTSGQLRARARRP